MAIRSPIWKKTCFARCFDLLHNSTLSSIHIHIGVELLAFTILLPSERVKDGGKMLLRPFLFLSCINLGKTAFAGLAETVIQVNAGLVHSAADHIITDVSGTGEEVT